MPKRASAKPYAEAAYLGFALIAALLCGLAAPAPRANAAGFGTPVWTNRYNGALGNSEDRAFAVGVDGSGNVFVTGWSARSGTGQDYATVAYSGAGVPLWTNRYGEPGSDFDRAQAVAVDHSGNVCVLGWSYFSGVYDSWTTIKYSGAGVPLWTNRHNGSPSFLGNKPSAVAVDGSGNVFVTGYMALTFYGDDYYTTIKYSGAGVPLWTNRFIGGNIGDALAVDASGDVFVTGSSSNGTNGDYTTIKYSGAGVPLWTNRYNGPANGSDVSRAIVVDGSGNVFVTGSSFDSNTLTNADFATVAYSGAGVPLWTNRYNGPGNSDDQASAVAVDGNGNVFVTGYSTGSGSVYDYATVAYSGAGVPLWTNRYNGPGNSDDRASALAVDTNGNVFVTGSSTGSASGNDYATVAYSNAGVPLWTNRYTGPGNNADRATSVSVDRSGNLFVTGSSWNGTNTDYGTIKYAGAGVSAGPSITTQPQTQTKNLNDAVTFSVVATGGIPLSYQWRFNGQNIPGATSATLTLSSLTAVKSGSYSVAVSNPYGSAVSATASLAVLTDGANGSQPQQVVYPSLPPSETGKDSLVFITHGRTVGPDSDDDWVDDMKAAIKQVAPPNWMVIGHKWIAQSRGIPGSQWVSYLYLKPIAEYLGRQAGADIITLGQLIPSHKWEHVHLIGHSAGAALINEAALVIALASPTTTIHTTFLDPYTGDWAGGRVDYGAYSHWADSYFAIDNDTRDPIVARTKGPLTHAHTVDVTWLDPVARPGYGIYYSGGSTPNVIVPQVLSSHGWPIQFYQMTIAGGLSGTAGYGYPLTKEFGGWNNNATTYPANNDPVVLQGPSYRSQNDIPLRADAQLAINLLPVTASDSRVNVAGGGFTLSGVSSQSLSAANWNAGEPAASGAGPAWLAVAVVVTNAVNLIQFDAAFTNSSPAQGLMSIYWNTNQIGLVDERGTFAGFRTYRFALPDTVMGGLYTLSFRLDSFTNASSSVVVTNVATGFVGLDQTVKLDMVRVASNTAPALQLTGASNYNYRVESSSNLVNWIPTALLENTNGTVLFADPAATNATRLFYRAFLE